MTGADFLARLADEIKPMTVVSSKGDHKGVSIALSDGSVLKFKRADVKAASSYSDVRRIGNG